MPCAESGTRILDVYKRQAWTQAQPENVEVSAEIKAPEQDVEMQYMSVEDASKHLGEEGYTLSLIHI